MRVFRSKKYEIVVPLLLKNGKLGSLEGKLETLGTKLQKWGSLSTALSQKGVFLAEHMQTLGYREYPSAPPRAPEPACGCELVNHMNITFTVNGPVNDEQLQEIHTAQTGATWQSLYGSRNKYIVIKGTCK